MSHDFEEILAEVKTVITGNLSAKLLAIATEKGDSIVLPPVDANAYAMQSMDQFVMNYDPFIVYGVSNIETIPNGPMNSEKIQMEIIIVLADNGRSNINQIMFRYLRSLKEIFQENWQLHNTSSKININSSTVVPLESLDSSAQYKAVGIEIETFLTS